MSIRVIGRPPVDLAFGEARTGVAMTADSLIPWFSCTKPVTAVAVMQLVEQGRVGLDDPIVDHIPEFGQGGKSAITVRHVLTHTGGFRSLVPAADPWRLEWDELVARICATQIEEGWVPGDRAGYHAVTGFHVLGELIQRIDGRAFADYVSEEILEPLDMGDSWMALSDERYRAYGDRMAVMYETAGSEGPRPLRGMDSARGFRRASPSGGGVGPMRDLVHLFEMFLEGGVREGQRVLSSESVMAMTDRQRQGLPDQTFGMVIDWGLGLMVNSWRYRSSPTSYGYGDFASEQTFGHGGQQSSLAFADPVVGLSVAMAFNGRPGEPVNHRRTQPVVDALYRDLGLTPDATVS